MTTIEGRARPQAAGTTSRLEVTFARTASGCDFRVTARSGGAQSPLDLC